MIKRLLCIVSVMNAGGAETFLMKLYRQIDRTKYQFDFCVNTKAPGFYDDEIKQLGGKLYYVPSKSENLKEFKSGLFNIVKENHYAYVLRTVANAAGLMDLKIAKKAGAKVCAARSSNSSDGGSLKALLAHGLGRLLYGKYVDVKIAPSDLAAIYTFGDKAYNKGDVHILHNGLDLDIFKYSENARHKIRDEFSINSSTTLVGHIGRFMEQKNHLFLLDIFEEYHKAHADSVLMLVGGNGNLEETVRQTVKNKNLDDAVIFTGIRSDIPSLLSAMDVMVMPSLYEGMPNVVIEAQATGLPCVISDSITKEANITNSVAYIKTNENLDNWCNKIELFRKSRIKSAEKLVRDSGYDIDDVAREFVSYIFKKH